MKKWRVMICDDETDVFESKSKAMKFAKEKMREWDEECSSIEPYAYVDEWDSITCKVKRIASLTMEDIE